MNRTYSEESGPYCVSRNKGCAGLCNSSEFIPRYTHCSYLDISISPKSSEKSDDFPDLTLAQYNLKK